MPRHVTDEFILPAVIAGYAGMQDGDGLLSFNFRSDRIREILGAVLQPEFTGFARPRRPVLAKAVSMTSYSAELDPLMPALFAPQTLANGLGETVAKAGMTQIRMAETEKYPHVTYFFNGGEETPYPGEDRVMVPSPKVATYDLQPEMSAPELTQRRSRRSSPALRSRRAELRQPRHGRPYRRAFGRDQGRRDGRCQPWAHRRRDHGGRRR
jgi:2,3-bisphosphoglycerate-independent phosphoglycerate mutase